MKILLRIGEHRVRVMRVMQYFTPMTFAASILTMIKVWELSWWSLFGVALILAVFYYVDNRGVIRGEIQYLNDNNDDIRAIRRNLEKINEHLGL